MRHPAMLFSDNQQQGIHLNQNAKFHSLKIDNLLLAFVPETAFFPGHNTILCFPTQTYFLYFP
jgi:hypothetical protein